MGEGGRGEGSCRRDETRGAGTKGPREGRARGDDGKGRGNKRPNEREKGTGNERGKWVTEGSCVAGLSRCTTALTASGYLILHTDSRIASTPRPEPMPTTWLSPPTTPHNPTAIGSYPHFSSQQAPVLTPKIQAKKGSTVIATRSARFAKMEPHGNFKEVTKSCTNKSHYR